jgi:CRP/FNR family transcriptional regulator
MNTPILERVKCSECPIRHRAVCARCDDGELSRLEAMKPYQTFKVGEAIIWRGEPLAFVASIVFGGAQCVRHRGAA